jgi:hypothetical protein
MLLRFQCSKSTDNPKIYVSSAARQQVCLEILVAHNRIEPDWLLIYKIGGNGLQLERTVTHADLS